MIKDYVGSVSILYESCNQLLTQLKQIKADNNFTDAYETYIESDWFIDTWKPIQTFFDFYMLVNLRLYGSKEEEFNRYIRRILAPKNEGEFDMLESPIKILSILCKNNKLQMEFAASFDDEEKARINESVHDCLEDCSYSCVAMSVSAVESRLHKLMLLVNPSSHAMVDDLTLGQLIKEYTDNPEKYKNIVPKKHKHLLNLCNDYRIFSVHPKGQEVTISVANSILNLAIEFLIDPNTSVPSQKFFDKVV